MKVTNFHLMLPLKIIFFSQTGIGLSANTFLFVFYIFHFLVDPRPKPIDVVVFHLTLTHIVMLFTTVILESPYLFESLNLPNDFKCKALFYMHRLMRGLSICTTCFLSVLQAITISHSTSWLVRFKFKSVSYTLHYFLSLWLLSLSFCSNLIVHTVALSNATRLNLNISKYCSLSPMNSLVKGLFSTLTLCRDFFFVGLMLLSSAYMVVLLSRHRKQTQHLHSTSLTSRISAEKRATQTILVLVNLFVVMYGADLIVSFLATLLWKYIPDGLSVHSNVGNVYANVSPLVLIRSDKRIKNVMQIIQRKCYQILISRLK